MKTAPPILGVSEIVLNVADLPKLREFYRDVLGFVLHSQVNRENAPGEQQGSDSNPTICFLTITATETPLGRNKHPQFLVLIDYRRHYFAKQRFDGHNVKRSTLNHLAFEIPPDSFEEHFERLNQLGILPNVTEFPTLEAKAMFFSDPEGNAIELICHHLG